MEHWAESSLGPQVFLTEFPRWRSKGGAAPLGSCGVGLRPARLAWARIRATVLCPCSSLPSVASSEQPGAESTVGRAAPGGSGVPRLLPQRSAFVSAGSTDVMPVWGCF